MDQAESVYTITLCFQESPEKEYHVYFSEDKTEAQRISLQWV
jgi:hypothetical protein